MKMPDGFQTVDMNICPLYIPSVFPDEEKGDCAIGCTCSEYNLYKYKECMVYKHNEKEKIEGNK
jgi:hypothetical protein